MNWHLLLIGVGSFLGCGLVGLFSGLLMVHFSLVSWSWSWSLEKEAGGSVLPVLSPLATRLDPGVVQFLSVDRTLDDSADSVDVEAVYKEVVQLAEQQVARARGHEPVVRHTVIEQ